MEAPRITREDLKRKLEGREELTLLDVRNPTDYSNSNVRIPGSIRMPLNEVAVRAAELDLKKEVVAYCT